MYKWRRVCRNAAALTVRGRGKPGSRVVRAARGIGGMPMAPPQRADRAAAGQLTACFSQPGTRALASRRNCTDISKTEAMSSRRPSNWGSRARRRSQLKEIRFLPPGK